MVQGPIVPDFAPEGPTSFSLDVSSKFTGRFDRWDSCVIKRARSPGRSNHVLSSA